MSEAASKFEQPSQAEQPAKKLFAFDYEKAELLAQEKIALEGASEEQDKMKRSALKKQINQLYGKAEDETPMRQIFNWEIEKQRLALAKKEVMAKLEKGEEFTDQQKKDLKLPPDARIIQYHKDTEIFSKSNKKGEQVKASFADLITDINWDNYYEFDDLVPLEFKKKYFEAYYQARIDQYTDKQILLQRIALEINPVKEPGLVRTYKTIDERQEIKEAGLLFEKMINNLLIKVSLDLPEWGLQMDRATIVEDVEEKIDFLIEFKKDYRGVNVEASDKEAQDKPLGIQFTMRNSENDPKFKIKQRQVAEKKKELKKIKDLVLISVPIKCHTIIKYYQKWQEQGKMPGGPENMFEAEQIAYFLAQILQDTEFAEKDKKSNFVLKEKYKSDLNKYLEKKG